MFGLSILFLGDFTGIFYDFPSLLTRLKSGPHKNCKGKPVLIPLTSALFDNGFCWFAGMTAIQKSLV